MTTKERMAKYHQEHRAEILARKKLYRETHKEQIKLYNATHRVKKGRKVREYALYKGDDFVDIGSKVELGEKYGLSPDFIAWTTTPSGAKHCDCPNYQGYIAIRLGFVGEEDDE